MAEALTSFISSIKNLPDFNITVPSFVFIGDESCGKSMLLESIAGLHICSDEIQDISSNVPLLFRIQDHLDPAQPEIITLSYEDTFVDVGHVDEIPNKIQRATKGITENNEITLVLKKKGAPDLFIVDLPEICREPTREKDDFLMKYMSPKETIIVNVVSAKSQFSTCKSTKLTQLADPTGGRTLHVIICADKEINMIEEGSALGSRVMRTYYVRERNRNESCEEANKNESGLFTTHVDLSKIPKTFVGVDLLVRKLAEMHTIMQSTWLPIVSSMIEGRILASLSNLDKVPQNLDGITGFMLYFVSSMKILRDRFIRRDSDEFSTYLIEQHNELLQQINTSFKSLDKFLEDEIDSMKKTTNQIQTSFQALMEKKLGGVAQIVNKFVDKIFTHLKTVTGTVMADRFKGYHPELCHLITYATSFVLRSTKEKYSYQVLKMIECEKKTIYSNDPSYSVSLDKIKSNQTRFSEAMRKQSMKMEVEGVGKVDLKHLQKIAEVERNQAFELKMKSMAYNNVLIRRVVDGAALELRSMIENVVTGEMVTHIVNTIIACGDDIDHLFQTLPLENEKRKKIENDIALLLETKKQIINVMDTIPHY